MENVEVYPDAAALARAAAESVIALAAEAITARGRFSIGLSGGSTPRALYTLLAAPEFAARVDWPNVHVFWGDERCVPPDHPDSNALMAREAWLNHVAIPASQIHRMRGESDPDQAAADYEQVLRAYFAQGPRFDLLLLGMGDDGHTASLFPSTAALHETSRWVAPNYVEKLNTWRITLTPPAINSAANVRFLIAGESKAAVLRDVLRGPYQPEQYPSQLVRPASGRLVWMVDTAASALL
jgi:6-phosphogluconolactonase